MSCVIIASGEGSLWGLQYSIETHKSQPRFHQPQNEPGLSSTLRMTIAQSKRPAASPCSCHS